MEQATTPKTRALDTMTREHATTLKVLRAFPTDKADFKPHERSNSAMQLLWTFVVEKQMALKALKREPLMQGGRAAPPAEWNAGVSALETQHAELVQHLTSMDNDNLDGTVNFFVGPKQMGDIPMDAFLTFMVHDEIHHRGQLSVYLRMAGGKVPSIYGPSADEPWM